jgi:hypothetical protein
MPDYEKAGWLADKIPAYGDYLAAAVEDLKKWKALAVAAEQVSEAAIQRKERAERLGLPHNAEITGG